MLSSIPLGSGGKQSNRSYIGDFVADFRHLRHSAICGIADLASMAEIETPTAVETQSTIMNQTSPIASDAPKVMAKASERLLYLLKRKSLYDILPFTARQLAKVYIQRPVGRRSYRRSIYRLPQDRLHKGRRLTRKGVS